MPLQVVQISERLNESAALQLAADLSLSDLVDDQLIDFSATAHFEPFGMLLASSAINRLRRRAEAAGRQVSIATGNADSEGLPAHMGFWQSIQCDLGRPVNSPAHKSSYLPITRIGIDEIYTQSAGGDPLVSGVIEGTAARLAQILAQPSSPPLLEAITYSLRELIRNVIEHARTPSLWIAGMSWPRRNYVQVAVLDEGIGIRKSLATSPEFNFDTDMESLRAAVRPGVSRNLNAQPSRESLEKWAGLRSDLPQDFYANAGYGLYMISSLCREAGQFLIASGSASLAYVGSGEIEGATGHHGTALRLVLQPSEIEAAMNAVFSGNFAKGPAGHKPMFSPSTLKRLGFRSLSSGVVKDAQTPDADAGQTKDGKNDAGD